MDACALNRISDDQSQPRIREEADAIEQILQQVVTGKLVLLGSVILQLELNANPDLSSRLNALELLSYASEIAKSEPGTNERARQLTGLGYGPADALHLAAAEQLKADVLITTDDRFLRLAGRATGKPLVKLRNPVNWLKEGLII